MIVTSRLVPIVNEPRRRACAGYLLANYWMLWAAGFGLGAELFEERKILVDRHLDFVTAQAGLFAGELLKRLGDRLLQDLEAELHRLGPCGQIDDEAFAANAGLGARKNGNLGALVGKETHHLAETGQLAFDDLQRHIGRDFGWRGTDAAEGEDERTFLLVAELEQRGLDRLAVIGHVPRDEFRRLQENLGDGFLQLLVEAFLFHRDR